MYIDEFFIAPFGDLKFKRSKASVKAIKKEPPELTIYGNSLMTLFTSSSTLSSLNTSSASDKAQVC